VTALEKKKKRKRSKWKEVEAGGVWDAASVCKWFLAVERAKRHWTRWPLQILLSCKSVLFSSLLAKYARPAWQNLLLVRGSVVILICEESATVRAP